MSSRRIARGALLAVALPALLLSGVTPSLFTTVVPTSDYVPIAIDPAAYAAVEDSGDATSPVALVGTIRGRGDVATGEVVAYAWPNQKVESLLEPGDVVPTVLVARATVDESGYFQLRIDPAQLPETHRSVSGLVNLDLFGWTSDEQGWYSVPIQSVSTDGHHRWVDPLSVPADGEIVEEIVQDSAVKVDFALSAPLVERAPNFSDTAHAVPGCGWGLVSSSNVNEVVARTTPTSGQTGSASFTSSQTHTTGVATSSSGTYGSWSASGTSSITSGFEQTWTTSSSLRNYRAQVTMGKYQYSTACGGGWKFQARFHTGGTSTETVSAPSYTNCASVSAGTWSRTSSSGSAHSLSAGLQATGVLGINLSASRQYSTTAKISYTQSGTKSVCGSNNVPSLAALVDGNP